MTKVTADIRALCLMAEQDVFNFIKWVWKLRWKTQFDPIVLTHPRMTMCTARDADGNPLVYLPLQSALMFDCLAPKPGLTNRMKSYCLWQIGQMAEQVMKDTGNCDAYFYTNDDDLAVSCSKHGWEEVKNVRLMRKRIPAPKLPENALPDSNSEASDGK